MKVTVLIDNLGSNDIQGEWGLSFFIEYRGRKYLLDTGGSALFIDNAKALGIDIADVDCAVLSHAHNDHSSGMEAFFAANSKAPFYLSPFCGENCYSGRLFSRHYIGLPKGILTRFPDRIEMRCGKVSLAEGVWIVPHTAATDSSVAAKSRLFIRKGLRFVPDDFRHEQSLVFETPDGLVIFNSCSHAGADVIIKEVCESLPGRSVRAYIGGLHLFRLDEEDIRKTAGILTSFGIPEIYTGHCTGERAFGILREYLGDTLRQMHSGLTFTF